MAVFHRIKHFWHLVSNVRPIVWMSIYLALIPLFALIYYQMPSDQFRSPDSAATNYGSWLYYSIVTITTLGFGDYTPAHGWSQAVSAIEVICGIILLGFFLNAVASMKSEIDVESELEKQRKIHYYMERDKLLKYLPVVLHRLQAYINYIKKHIVSVSHKDLTRSDIHIFISEALRTSIFLDSLLSRVDLTLWPPIIEKCFTFVANIQMHETSESPLQIKALATETSKIASDLQTEFTKASTKESSSEITQTGNMSY